jgi:hypothetical protein
LTIKLAGTFSFGRSLGVFCDVGVGGGGDGGGTPGTRFANPGILFDDDDDDDDDDAGATDADGRVALDGRDDDGPLIAETGDFGAARETSVRTLSAGATVGAVGAVGAVTFLSAGSRETLMSAVKGFGAVFAASVGRMAARSEAPRGRSPADPLPDLIGRFPCADDGVSGAETGTTRAADFGASGRRFPLIPLPPTPLLTPMPTLPLLTPMPTLPLLTPIPTLPLLTPERASPLSPPPLT